MAEDDDKGSWHPTQEAALPAQQPLRHHVERMAQFYQLGRVKRRAPALPARDLGLTVARQRGKLSAIHAGLGHPARQAHADPLLLGDVVLPWHRRTILSQSSYTQMSGDGRHFSRQNARFLTSPWSLSASSSTL